MNKDAAKIANIIKNTDSDFRGNLLILVADHLARNTQYFTANLIKSAAIEYGVNPKAEGHPRFEENQK